MDTKPQTNKVRKQKDLAAPTSIFYTLKGERANEKQLGTIPCCWENYPGYENYRGEAIYETNFTAAGNVRIECKGISHYAKIYVDGELRTEH